MPRPRLALALLFTPLIACAEGDSTGFSGTDAPCLAEYGYRWCVRVEGAFAEVPGVGSVAITDPADNDLAPKGCACAAPHENDDLNDEVMNNQVVIGASMPNNLRNGIRNIAYANAEARCVELADGMGATDDDCDEQLDKVDGDMSNPEVTPLFPEGASDECPGDSCFDGGEGAGMAPAPSDGYDDYYVLTNVIVRTQTTHYEIDEAFFDDMLDNPAWLLADGGRLVPILGGAAFEFQGIQTGDVLNKLGINNGDRVRSLNSISIGDWDDVLYAFWELRTETEFELELLRSSTIITRTYEVVP